MSLSASDKMPRNKPEMDLEVVRKLRRKRRIAPLEKRPVNDEYRVEVKGPFAEEPKYDSYLERVNGIASDTTPMSEDSELMGILDATNPKSGLVAQVAGLTRGQFVLALENTTTIELSEGCGHQRFYCCTDSYTKLGQQIPFDFLEYVLNNHGDSLYDDTNFGRQTDSLDYRRLVDFLRLWLDVKGKPSGYVVTNAHLGRRIGDIREILSLGVDVVMSNRDEQMERLDHDDVEALEDGNITKGHGKLDFYDVDVQSRHGFYGLHEHDGDVSAIEPYSCGGFLYMRPSGFYTSFVVDVTEGNPHGVVYKPISRDFFLIPNMAHGVGGAPNKLGDKTALGFLYEHEGRIEGVPRDGVRAVRTG